jgi:ubiquinone/menaquinone biosynthesis C-methylase UbiE
MEKEAVMDAKLWNQSAGHGWVAVEAAMDAMFAAFDELLLEGVAARHVLDVGCGTGSTLVAAALRLGADCAGIDPSAPMIAAARARVERCGVAARFVQGDAQTYPFDPGGFDLVLSRFGVMFFADPPVAFANLRRAAAPGGRLRFAAWRDAGENSFMTAAERAAAPLLPRLPARKPDEPGQFAFADRGRIETILKKSGWTDIDIRPIDVACRFAEKELMPYLTWMGPVGRALQQADEGTRARVMDVVRPAFDSFVQAGEVRFTSACWMVDAHA